MNGFGELVGLFCRVEGFIKYINLIGIEIRKDVFIVVENFNIFWIVRDVLGIVLCVWFMVGVFVCGIFWFVGVVVGEVICFLVICIS